MKSTYTTLFSGAFRPLFLLAGLYAPLVLLLWLAYLFSYITLPAQSVNPLLWHSHEMIFGFAGAAMGGFAFTAVANWTGRTPVQGMPLLLLCVVWLLGRCAMIFLEPGWLAMALDGSYLVLVILMLMRELYLGKNRRNYIIAAILGLLLVFNVIYHMEINGSFAFAGAGMRGAIITVILMVSLIGGRIIPAFSGNWLKARNEKGELPAAFGKLDIASLLSTVFVLVSFVLIPYSTISGAVLLIAALLHTLRLNRWQTRKIAGEPLLLVLHVAYAWIPFGFLLLASSSFLLVSPSVGLHALTIGAITTMVMGVSIRAGKGHSGRELTTDTKTNLTFILITSTAVTRVISSLLPFDWLLQLSAILWLLSFLAFLVVVVPILSRPSISH
jgi:uncharacterized protein involved in response to NO